MTALNLGSDLYKQNDVLHFKPFMHATFLRMETDAKYVDRNSKTDNWVHWMNLLHDSIAIMPSSSDCTIVILL